MRLVLTRKNIHAIKTKMPEATITPDDYLTRLIKFVPSEVVALYITLYALANSSRNEIAFDAVVWAIFIVGIIATPLYLWRVAKVADWTQMIISTIAFVVWIFALGGPFSTLSWYHPVYGALLLPVYTFFVPIISRT